MSDAMETMFEQDGGRHLSSAQMDDLLFASGAPETAADKAVGRHLRACPACAGELAELRASLGLLRDAATGMASQQVDARKRTALRSRGGLAVMRPAAQGGSLRAWPVAIAASLLITAAMVPLAPRIRHAGAAGDKALVAAPAHSVADDEALLRDIDRQLSASVPTALEPLADPRNPKDPANDSRQNSTPTKKD